MLSRSYLLVLGLLAPYQAARIDSKVVQVDSSSPVNASFETLVEVYADMIDSNRDTGYSGIDHNGAPDYFNSLWDQGITSKVLALSMNPKVLQLDMFEGIAKFDFSGDIGAQIAQLVAGTALGTLGMANPIVGAVYSVFEGLNAIVDPSPEQRLIRRYLNQVDKMISRPLAHMTDLNREMMEHMSIRERIRMIGSAYSPSSWVEACGYLRKHVKSVFTPHCWDNPSSAACETWQTCIEGGAIALILEIEYTQLMISAYLELRRLAQNGKVEAGLADHYDGKAELMVSFIHDAGLHTHKHAIRWKAYKCADERKTPKARQCANLLKQGKAVNLVGDALKRAR